MVNLSSDISPMEYFSSVKVKDELNENLERTSSYTFLVCWLWSCFYHCSQMSCSKALPEFELWLQITRGRTAWLEFLGTPPPTGAVRETSSRMQRVLPQTDTWERASLPHTDKMSHDRLSEVEGFNVIPKIPAEMECYIRVGAKTWFRAENLGLELCFVQAYQIIIKCFLAECKAILTFPQHS